MLGLHTHLLCFLRALLDYFNLGYISVKLCQLSLFLILLPLLLLLLHDPLLLPLISLPLCPLPLSLIHSVFLCSLLLLVENALVLLQVLGCLLLCLEGGVLPLRLVVESGELLLKHCSH